MQYTPSEVARVLDLLSTWLEEGVRVSIQHEKGVNDIKLDR
jgi:hypothetical protein